MGEYKTKLLIEEHFHGCYGVDFATCKADEIVELSKKLLQNHGIGGFFPTLATDSIENIKRQIVEIKKASQFEDNSSAKILGIHLEGIFLNPKKKGIHDENQFLPLTIENFKLIEDEFIKIVTLAPELDKDLELSKYLKSKGIKVHAGHCIGGDLSMSDGITHLFNGMEGISHRNSSTALSALTNDKVYTEIIADGIHLSDDILQLIFKSKPDNKIILISDSLPIAYSDNSETDFCNKKIFYNGEKATDKNGTIAGSTKLLNDIIKILKNKNIDAFKFINNPYEYHKIDIKGEIIWDENFNIISAQKML